MQPTEKSSDQKPFSEGVNNNSLDWVKLLSRKGSKNPKRYLEQTVSSSFALRIGLSYWDSFCESSKEDLVCLRDKYQEVLGGNFEITIGSFGQYGPGIWIKRIS